MKIKGLLALLLIIGFILAGCNKVTVKMSEQEIKDTLETNTDETVFTVHDVTYASDSITINGIDVKVNGGTISFGEDTFKSSGKVYKQVTGYFEQPSATYHLFVLSENKKGENAVWATQVNNGASFNDAEWVYQDISAASDLILIDCEEISEAFGQTPTRYQVYALADNRLVLVG